jgi:hypothetical protein
MSGVESRQKAEYVAHEVIKRGKSDYLQLTYKRLDGQTPGVEMKTGNFVAKLDEATKNLIKAKGSFVVVKTKEGDYWNLSKVDDVSTYTANTNTGGRTSYNAKGSTSTYNTAGIKVGAVTHDAVALVGVGGKISDVKKLAEELLYMSYELEANINAGKYEVTSKVTTTTHGAVGEEVEETTLDNIDF